MKYSLCLVASRGRRWSGLFEQFGSWWLPPLVVALGVLVAACSGGGGDGYGGGGGQSAPAEVPPEVAPYLTPPPSVTCQPEPVLGTPHSAINCDYGTYSTCTIIVDGDIEVFFPTDTPADIQYDDLVGTTTIRFSAPCIFWKDYVPELSYARPD